MVGCGKAYHYKNDPKDSMVIFRRTCGEDNNYCKDCSDANCEENVGGKE